MALPIAATPTLEGEEARKFYKEMVENLKRGISREEVLRGDEIFRRVMRNSPEMRHKLGVPDDI
jgi:hypothetical protein